MKKRFILNSHINYIFLIVVLCGTMLVGCESSYTKKFQASNSDYGSRDDANQQTTDNKMYGPTIQGIKHHQNKKLQYSKELSTVLSEMPGVYSGIVMVTDKNAYASIIYDNSATGIRGTGTADESDHTGTTTGMYDRQTGNQTIGPNQIATGINSHFTERKHENLSSRMKQEVARKLREKNPQLAEVYITANREFINQMNVYYVESTRGVDLNRYVEDFNRLVNVHFGS